MVCSHSAESCLPAVWCQIMCAYQWFCMCTCYIVCLCSHILLYIVHVCGMSVRVMLFLCMWYVCLLYTAKWQYSLLPAEQVSLTASDIVTVNTDPPASCSRPAPSQTHLTPTTPPIKAEETSLATNKQTGEPIHTHTHTCTHSHIHCIYCIAIKFGELALSRYWWILNLAIWTLSTIGTHTIINIDEF